MSCCIITINTYEYRVKSYLTYFSLNLPWIYRRQNFATNFILAFLPPLISGLIKSPRQPPLFNCQLLIKDFGVWTSLPIGSTQSDQRGCPIVHATIIYKWCMILCYIMVLSWATGVSSGRSTHFRCKRKAVWQKWGAPPWGRLPKKHLICPIWF